MIKNDDTFDALADVRRRELLVSLLDRDFCHVSELSDASREMAEASDTFLDEYLAGSQEIDDVDDELLSMHRVHLPKLHEYGFVDWNWKRGVVKRGPRYSEIEPILEFLDENESDGRTGRRAPVPAELLR